MVAFTMITAYLCFGVFLSIFRYLVYQTLPPHTPPTLSSSLRWCVLYPIEIIAKIAVKPIPSLPDRPAPPKPSKKTYTPGHLFFSQEERASILDDLVGVTFDSADTEGGWLRERRRTRKKPNSDRRRQIASTMLDVYENYYVSNGVGPTKEVLFAQVKKKEGIPEDSDLAVLTVLTLLRFLWIIYEWYQKKNVLSGQVE